MSESSDVIARLQRAGYKVRSKEKWGSKELGVYAQRLRSKPVDFPVSYGFVHITVTHEHGDAGARLIEQIGQERFGSGVSYNWLMDHATDHTVYVGQPLGSKGTHTVNDRNVPGFPNNLNYVGHAVAYMGDVGDAVCDECVDTIAAIFAAEQIEGTMRHGRNVYPHRKFAQKSCPGDKLAARMDDINDLVVAKVKAGDVSPHGHAPAKKVAKKPAKKAAGNSRVTEARDLLEKAAKAAKAPSRKKKIATALDDLPEE